MHKILAYDQASRVSGWSFFIDGELKDYGHFSFEFTNFSLRLLRICEQMEGHIKKFEPDLILLENISMEGRGPNNVNTFQKLAQVQGAMMMTAQKHGIDHKLVYPNEWRSACNFLKGEDKHRDNQKKIAQQWVAQTFGRKCTQDEADAICIGYSEAMNEMVAF